MRPLRIPPGPDQESVWDYPRPPAVEPVAGLVRVVLAGVTIAESARALRVLETSHPPNYYLPPADVDAGPVLCSLSAQQCEGLPIRQSWLTTAPTPGGGRGRR